jgi:hypothetical protein
MSREIRTERLDYIRLAWRPFVIESSVSIVSRTIRRAFALTLAMISIGLCDAGAQSNETARLDGPTCGDDARLVLRTEPNGTLTHDLEKLPYTGGRLIATVTRADGTTSCNIALPVSLAFPDAEDIVRPHPILIPKGKSYATVELRADRPRVVTLRAIVDGLPRGLQVQPLTVRFVAPVYSVFLDAEQENLVQWLFSVPTTKMKVRLVDRDRRNTERGGEVVVSLDVDRAEGQPVVGEVRPRTLRFASTDDELEAVYAPMEVGQATIRAAATINGYPIGNKPALIRFSYSWWEGPFLLLCMLAGLAGAFLRGVEQRTVQKKALNIKDDGARFALCGVLGGIILFLLGSRLLRTEFNEALVTVGSRPLAAMYWGLLGGYLGPLPVIKKLKPL